MKKKKPKSTVSLTREILPPITFEAVTPSEPVNSYDYYIDYASEDPISISIKVESDDQLSAVFDRLLLDGHTIPLPGQDHTKAVLGKSKELADVALDGVLRVVVLSYSTSDPGKKKIGIVAHGGPKQPDEINFYLQPYPNGVNVFLINFTINMNPWQPVSKKPI